MDETLQLISQIATSGGPVLLIFVLYIGHRAMRAAEKAVEAFNAMRTDIATIKTAVAGNDGGKDTRARIIELSERVEKLLDNSPQFSGGR